MYTLKNVLASLIHILTLVMVFNILQWCTNGGDQPHQIFRIYEFIYFQKTKMYSITNCLS